jgi:iron complex outermembrane receptor protein
VTSRDVRAPNLSELFAAPVTTTLPNFFDPVNNRSVVAIQNAVGNPNLTPEIARNTQIGVVLANPSWLPGFSASFDYYKIKIDDVVSSLGAAQIVDYCFRNILPQTCGAYNLNNTNGPNYINVQSFNLASIKTSGFDIEASYRWQQPLGLDGQLHPARPGHAHPRILDRHGPARHDPGRLRGREPPATRPNWKWLAIQSYERRPLQPDGAGALVQRRQLRQPVCRLRRGGLPGLDAQRPTIDKNFMPGAFYMDVGGTYNIRKDVTAYFKVDNLFDRDPAKSPNYANPALYDIVGRMYRGGVRFRF